MFPRWLDGNLVMVKSITIRRFWCHSDFTVICTGLLIGGKVNHRTAFMFSRRLDGDFQPPHGVYVFTVKIRQFLAASVWWIQIHRRITVVITWQRFIGRYLGGIFCGNCTAIFLRWLDGGILRWMYGEFNFTAEPPRQFHGDTKIAVFHHGILAVDDHFSICIWLAEASLTFN